MAVVDITIQPIIRLRSRRMIRLGPIMHRHVQFYMVHTKSATCGGIVTGG
jgi:hypothetical protein